MSGNIFNSNGTRVGVVDGATIFSLNGQELYHLKGINIYRLSGELVGHLDGTQGSDKRLDRSTDKLFSARAVLKTLREVVIAETALCLAQNLDAGHERRRTKP